MKKSYCAAFLAASSLLAFLAPAAVQADVILPPSINYDRNHSDICTPVNRTDTVKGNTNFYISPSGRGVAAVVKNSCRVRLVSKFTDQTGTIWYKAVLSDGRSGWVTANRLNSVYDSNSFIQAHTSEINSNEAAMPAEPHKAIIFWSYPNSGRIAGKADGDSEHGLVCAKTWNDPKGRRWGYVTYYRGIRGCWVCMDDPYNEHLR